MKVVPLITPDQRIQMDLEVRQDTVGEIFTGALGAEIPSIDTRELQTTVLVGNGGTILRSDGSGGFRILAHSSGVDFASVLRLSEGRFLLTGEEGFYHEPESAPAEGAP